MIRSTKGRRKGISQMTITIENIGDSKAWVAEITGTDPKFGLKREFCNGIRNYSKANSKGTRGIETTYELTAGKIYEINEPQSWKNTNRRIVYVAANDKRYKIDAKDALALLAGADPASIIPTLAAPQEAVNA